MNSKICIFCIVFAFVQYSSGWEHSIYKPTTSIYLGKTLEAGDIIKVTGRYAPADTQASFDLENEYCDWMNGKYDGCLEYDTKIIFAYNQMFRRILKDNDYLPTVDKYDTTHIRRNQFYLIIRIKTNHIEMVLDGYELQPWPITEPLSKIDIFRAYGTAIIDSFKYECNGVPW